MYGAVKYVYGFFQHFFSTKLVLTYLRSLLAIDICFNGPVTLKIAVRKSCRLTDKVCRKLATYMTMLKIHRTFSPIIVVVLFIKQFPYVEKCDKLSKYSINPQNKLTILAEILVCIVDDQLLGAE